jgi:hypothetical protein
VYDPYETVGPVHVLLAHGSGGGKKGGGKKGGGKKGGKNGGGVRVVKVVAKEAGPEPTVFTALK